MVYENNAIVEHPPGSPNGGRHIGVQKQRQSNRHWLHRSAAQSARRQRPLLGLAMPAGLGQTSGYRAASAATDFQQSSLAVGESLGLHARLEMIVGSRL